MKRLLVILCVAFAAILARADVGSENVTKFPDTDRVKESIVVPTSLFVNFESGAELRFAGTAATAVGKALATAPNPSAIRFVRINANNTVSLLTAEDFLTAIGAGTGGGAVDSVNGETGVVVLDAADVGADPTGSAAAAQAAAVQRANHTGTQSADTLTDGTTNKAFLATERTKLAGIATGATANATDAQLRDRSTHTGTQTMSTISDAGTLATQSGTFSGTHSGSSSGTNTGDQDLSSYAPLASPTFTGVPAAPTAAADTSTTQLATTAFAKAEADAAQSAAATDATTKANSAQAAAVQRSNHTGTAEAGVNSITAAAASTLTLASASGQGIVLDPGSASGTAGVTITPRNTIVDALKVQPSGWPSSYSITTFDQLNSGVHDYQGAFGWNYQGLVATEPKLGIGYESDYLGGDGSRTTELYFGFGTIDAGAGRSERRAMQVNSWNRAGSNGGSIFGIADPVPRGYLNFGFQAEKFSFVGGDPEANSIFTGMVTFNFIDKHTYVTLSQNAANKDVLLAWPTSGERWGVAGNATSTYFGSSAPTDRFVHIQNTGGGLVGWQWRLSTDGFATGTTVAELKHGGGSLANSYLELFSTNPAGNVYSGALRTLGGIYATKGFGMGDSGIFYIGAGSITFDRPGGAEVRFNFNSGGHSGLHLKNNSAGGRDWRLATWADGSTGRFIVRDDTGGNDRLTINSAGDWIGTSTTEANAATPAGSVTALGGGYFAKRIITPSTITGGTLVAAKTSAYPVVATEPRTLFTNEGASSGVTFTLPTAVANLSYTFVVQDTDGITITAASGDTIRFAATVTAAAGSITSTTIGSTITLVAINATEWVAISVVGTWA